MSQHWNDGSEKRELDTGRTDPALEIVEIVSELEDEEVEELTPLWDWIDGLLENIFSTPPTPEAEARVSFNYEGYRITVDQEGFARFDEKD